MSFSNNDEICQALLSVDPCYFVSQYMLETVPFVFDGSVESWVHWKTLLSRFLDVDPYEIVLAGSASIGYSLNPKKGFSRFHSNSDIDVCVISQHHFEVAWRYLRQTRAEWLSLPKKTKNDLDSHRKNYIFSGAIATDKILPLLPFGQQWQAGLDEMAKRSPTLNRDIKLRIYRDFDALRAYHSAGIRRLREEILDEPSSDDEIGTQE